MADETDNVADISAENQDVVTMVDVLKEEQELEEDAKAVLGGSDTKDCTYSQGYLKRQALYACITCIPEAKEDPTKRAGVCLACSYACHEGHELIELYTKRDFRCDCGNSKFGNRKCNLEPNKSDVNELNKYNHNFSGLYCNCERPYPDPEDNVVDDMIQCVICEDWYHCRHLGAAVPGMNSYSEMTCRVCVENNDFLLYYSGLTVTKVKAEGKEDETVNVVKEGEKDVESTSKEKEPEVSCQKPAVKSDLVEAKFWVDNWRKQLCACDSCKKLYEDLKVSFLLDQQDTVHEYEEKGKARAGSSSKSQYEQGIEALSRVDRVKATEAIMQYNDMMLHLKDYLQKFADNKKIVREEDIKEFFDGMSARKKQKTDIPYFCR